MFGIVDDSSFEQQLESLNKPIQRATVVNIQRGRVGKEVPVELKKLVASDSINGVSASELSKQFGISPSSISAYKNDATSTKTYHEPDAELKESNDKVRTDITNSARSKLLQALETITPEKLNDTKVRDAAGIAKDMSAIIKNLEPESHEKNQLNQQFIFYAPKTKQESDFEVIEARE